MKANAEKLSSFLEEKSGNIIKLLDEQDVKKIGTNAVRDFEEDWGDPDYTRRRSIWEKGERLLKNELPPKDFPFEKASNVNYPLLTVASTQFASRSMPELIPGDTVCRPKILGSVQEPQLPPEAQQMIQQGTSEEQVRLQLEERGLVKPSKLKRAEHVCQFVNWQLSPTGEISEWTEQTDRLLTALPLFGSQFREVYYGKEKNRICTGRYGPNELVMPYKSKTVGDASRITKSFTLYPRQVRERHRSGWFDDVVQFENEEQEVAEEFIEQFVWLDLDDDEFKEPYILTVHKRSGQCVRISPNFDKEGVLENDKGEVQKIRAKKYFVKYSFLPSVEETVYDVGFFDILYPLNETVNTTINQLLDAGTLQNTNSGFITQDFAARRKGQVKMQIGKLLTVPTNGQAIKGGIHLMDWKGPSTVLFSLLGFVLEAGKEVANLKEVLEGQTRTNMQPTTVMALIEQGLKVYSGIHKRIHRSLTEELQLIRKWNYEIRNPLYRLVVDERVTREDFEDADLDFVPVSDPKSVTDMQKMAKVEFKMQFLNSPYLKQADLIEQIWEDAGIDGFDELRTDTDPQMQQMQQMLQQAQQQIAQLSEALKDKRAEMMLRAKDDDRKDAETDAKVIKDKAAAVKSIADAEAAELGQQVDTYIATMESLNGETGLRGMGGKPSDSGDSGVSQGGDS